MPAIQIADLNNAKTDVDHIADFANSPALTATDRLAHTKRTLAGIDAEAESRMDAHDADALARMDAHDADALARMNTIDTAAAAQRTNIQSSADLVLAGLGYGVPVAYTSGLSMTLQTQTVSYLGETYAPIQSQLPFTTSGTFETAKFRLIQGVAAADLALSTGATLVGTIASGTGAVARTVRDKLRDVAYATDFMTSAQIADVRAGTGSLDVTAAVQAAIDAANTVIFPPGTYKIVCTSTPAFTYGNNASVNVYRALNINKSNLTLIGQGATIKVFGHGAGSTDINYGFSTAKNMNVGDVTNIRARGLRFDFNPTGDASSTKRSFYFGGVEGLFLDDIELTSSGARSGATVTFQQCKTVRITNFRLKNCTQGMNFSYVTDIQGSNWMFDNFVEAVDFDRKNRGINLSNLSFINASTGQALDLNSAEDCTIDGVYLDTVLNALLVNYKHTTPPTYAEYVTTYAVWIPSHAYAVGNYTQNGENFYICTTAGTSASSGGPTGTSSGIADGTVVWDYVAVSPFALSPSKRVTVRGIRGNAIGSASAPSINLGIDRTAWFNGFGPCEDIAIEDVKLTNCGYVNIEDVKRFKLRDVVLDTVLCPTSSSYAAITISADATYSDAEVSGEVRDVDVMNSTNRGVRAMSPTRLVLDGVRVDGFNTANTAGNGYAFDMQGLNNRRGQFFIDRCLARSGNNSPVAWRLSENGSGSYESQLFWGVGNRIDTATVPIPFGFGQAGMQKRIKKRSLVSMGNFTLTSGTHDRFLLTPAKNEGIYFCWLAGLAAETLAADATNNVKYNVKSRIAGVEVDVSIGSFSAGMTAGAETDMQMTHNETAVTLAYGDHAYVQFGVNGAGGTIKGLGLEVFYLDYATS